MAGRRTWGVVQQRLVDAAQNKFAKGDALGDVLFVSETWSLNYKDEIEKDRKGRLSRSPQQPASRPTVARSLTAAG